MGILVESIIATLAAVGLICICKSLYDIIFTGFLRMKDCAELYLFGNDNDVRSEQLMRTAVQIRRLYIPGLSIVFFSNGGTETETLRRLAEHWQISFWE